MSYQKNIPPLKSVGLGPKPKAHLQWLVKLPADNIGQATNIVAKALRKVDFHKEKGYHVSYLGGVGQAANGMYVIQYIIGTNTDDPNVLDNFQSLVDSVLDQFSYASKSDIVKR